jgi:hypothetical protein
LVKGGGIALFNISGSEIFNNSVVENMTDIGGGIYIQSSPGCTIINCTVAYNQATLVGGGICTYQFSYPEIRNSIVFHNQAAESPALMTSTDDSFAVSYSDIEGGWAGVEVMNELPLFANGAYGDFFLCHIAAGQSVDSPVIDRGDSSAANYLLDTMTTRTDQVGDEGIVDLGYHYYRHPSSGGITQHRKSQIPDAIQLSAYPNPFNTSTRIQFTLPIASRVEVIVYDILGQQVTLLADGFYSAGNHWINWSSRNDRMPSMSSGMYFVKLKTPTLAQSLRIIYLK